MTRHFDIAVFGSGYAGSLMAMIARRQGHSVLLLERGTHPRFAIGESSTPLANLLLEELTNRYDLPSLKPLTKWGSWQQSYPEIACGLKRGFTFYHHQLGVEDLPDPDRERQLLVAASPHDHIADTHWYRADFDSFFVEQAKSFGVDYIDQVALGDFIEHPDHVTFNAVKDGITSTYHAGFAIDATGPHGFLQRALQLSEQPLPDYPVTQALYSHFSGVALPQAPPSINDETPPYPPESAAVHHVFNGGWIWVLRFNNGITSAGVAATTEAAKCLNLSEGESAWHRLLDLLPALKHQFRSACAEQPFVFVPRPSTLSSQLCSKRWAMLPSSAGFVDPLLSTGFPLTLLGISRLAKILDSKQDPAAMQSSLETYSAQTRNELLATFRLIGSLYRNMHNFPVFKALSLLYFAAASYSESARRLGKHHLAKSFLLQDDPLFGPSSKAIFEQATEINSPEASEQLIQKINEAIKPFDVAGVTNSTNHSWYPVNADDLLRSAAKVESTYDEIQALLLSCGFYAA